MNGVKHHAKCQCIAPFFIPSNLFFFYFANKMHSRFHEKHVSALTAIEVYELRSFYDTIFVKFSEM